MRWENLFDDLAGQLEHELGAEELELHSEEERLRIGRLTLRDRLVAVHDAAGRHGDYRVRVQLVDGRQLTVLPRSLGRDWLMGDVQDESSLASQCIVPLAAIGSLILDDEHLEKSLQPGTSATPRLSDRLGLTFVLRDLARRRRAVELHASFGVLHGTIDRVGRDHIDLAEHEVGTPRRRSEVAHRRIVPLERLVWVRL
ncbi:MAG: hypothetical protein KF680_04145 [Cryobacterium sp.]|nr:hypothetical protein [Cryobacterium sp.]